MENTQHLVVPVDDIVRAVAWYRKQFPCEVLSVADNWAMLRLGAIDLSLVVSDQDTAPWSEPA